MKKLIFIPFMLLIILSGCNKSDNPNEQIITYGRNDFQTNINGVNRAYIVSVPQSYNAQTKIPVVFMLHGTGQDGQKFYNDSGWKELGEQENILTVFPSSSVQCIFTDGQQKTTSKWNSQPASDWSYCPNQTIPDDVKFLGQIIDELEEKYTIDTKRIYFIGFSNGAQMCAKLSIQMSERIAAIVESASAFSIDTTFVPNRQLPITYQLGNKDDGPGGTGPEIPLSAFSIVLSTPGTRPNITMETTIKSFDLNPNYTLTGDTNTIVVATYKPNNGNVINNFHMAFIKGMGHIYPNGQNHWLYGAQAHWDWMKGFTLP